MTRSFLLGWVTRLAIAALVFLTVGCHSVPEGRSSVDAVSIKGSDKVDDGDIEDAIATTPSEKFLGLFRGILYEYSVFDRNVLQRDLARIEAFYRDKGYYEAHARAGRIYRVDDKHVRVEIVIEEGPPTLVRNVTIVGIENLPQDLQDLAKREASLILRANKPFKADDFDNSVGKVRRALTDRGYAYAKVKNDAAVDLVEHKADITLTVTPGDPCTFGPVTIVGLKELPDANVRRAANVKPGAKFDEADLDSAQQALLDLGVFAAVDVKPDLSNPENHAVPITIKVEESRLRTLKLGGGLEFDALKTDIHGLIGWEHKNFLGGLRSLKVTFQPGVVLYPLRFNNFVAPNKFLPEERLRLEFQQPSFFEARTSGFIRPELNAQPLLLDPNPPPNQPVLGYAELRNGVGVERTFWKVTATVSHNFQAAFPYVYVGRKDPTLGPLYISYPEILLTLDLRNDRIHPRKGIYLLNTFQVAGGPFGGQARDVKIQPDLRAYVPITKKRVTLAVRGSFGLLLPQNYGGSIENPRSVFEGSEERTRDYQLTYFRGFFSGGPTSNRGYPLRGVGPYDLVPFLSPEAEALRVNQGCGGSSSYDCRSPTGGFTLWEASVEVRFVVHGPLSVATFCDSSDVSPRTVDFRLNHPHLSCGAGGRYDTPVGPVRLDIGYRIPGLQVIGGLTRDEEEPQTFPLGIPIAVSFGIGEAY